MSDPTNPMVSVPYADEGMRWFRAVDPEKGIEGPWHLGVSATGWPAGPAICGHDQPDKEVGRHITAAGALAHQSDFCPTCLKLARMKASQR